MFFVDKFASACRPAEMAPVALTEAGLNITPKLAFLVLRSPATEAD
jgi:hypothetical protein